MGNFLDFLLSFAVDFDTPESPSAGRVHRINYKLELQRNLTLAFQQQYRWLRKNNRHFHNVIELLPCQLNNNIIYHLTRIFTMLTWLMAHYRLYKV